MHCASLTNRMLGIITWASPPDCLLLQGVRFVSGYIGQEDKSQGPI